MEQNTNKVGKHSAPQQVQGESFFRRLLKKPGVQSFLAALLCIVIGLVVGYIVLLAMEPSGASKAIGAVLKNFLARRSSALRMKQFANTLVKTAPLIMCSLSILFAYKTGLFNIGAAGQYVLGAGAALYCALGLELPWYVCLLAAAAAGALLGCISGALKAYCNVNEVISCIMLNWISLYAVNSVLKDFCPVGYKDTFTLVSRNSSALLPSLGLNKVFGSESATIAIPMAVIIAIIIWVVLEKTKFGYEIKATGLNRNAAKYCGMREKRNIILTMFIAGALAGIAAGGLFVGIMWPGVYSLAGREYKVGGTKMFGLLALAGDVGCTVGPTLSGAVSSDIRTGLLVSTVFPVVLLVGTIALSLLLKKSHQQAKTTL